MIDTDKRGQEKLDELRKALVKYGDDFTHWEHTFLNNTSHLTYAQMTPPQKRTVGDLYDRAILGVR